MMPLESQLKKSGFDCLNIKYPSRNHPIEELADIVAEKMENEPAYKTASKTHFVGHSMGGLLSRYIIARHRPPNLGSVVMMGTPNQGSEVADFLADNKYLAPAFHTIFGPASHQLRTSHAHIDDGKVDYDLGIIASDISINPLGKKIFDGANDTLVAVEKTNLEGRKGHIVMPSTHTIMMWDPRIQKQVLHFLEKGDFDYNDKTIRPVPEQQDPITSTHDHSPEP